MQPGPGHNRSSSFFSFFTSRQSDSSGHNRALSQQDMSPQPSVPLRSGPPQPSSQSQPQPQTPPPAQQLHPEIRSVVQLNHAHAHKVYFSGPLIRKLEYNTDGQNPIKDEGWIHIWAQLGGTTLSVWDIKEIEAASKQGREVPPSYINVTDAYIQILGGVTVPATSTSPSIRYQNVLTVNTAGANLYLLSCQTPQALASWVAALRLACWEKTRLDEIYTAHLIRITLIARDVPTTLVKGKMEGWARIRISGQRDWKKVWMVVQEGSGDRASDQHTAPATNGNAAVPPTVIRKRRVSNIFSSSSPTTPNASSVLLPSKSFVSIYNSPKPKDRKKPLLTITNVFQVFAVYPERPELISKSSLMKIEGFLEDGEMAGEWSGKEGWAFVMPEGENGNEKQQAGAAGQGGGLVAEMLKWIVALHDAFKLYGRPGAWTWDPRNPVSLMYGYPVGTMKETLFLDREIVEKMDPRIDKTSIYRVGFKNLLQQHMRLPVQIVNPQNGGPRPAGVPVGEPGTANPNPTGVGNGALPPLPQSSDRPASPPSVNVGVGGPQLPPLAFGSGEAATTNAPNNINPNVNNVPANNNNGPASRLSTIEEMSVATHNGNQHQHLTELQGDIGRPGPGSGGSVAHSLPPPPHRPENLGAPAVPAKLPPSSVTGPSARQPLHSSNVPSPLSQSQPQSLRGSMTPPRFQNQGQGGFGNSISASRTSPPPGPNLTKFRPPSGQSSQNGSRVGSPASGSPVPNFPSDQQSSGATATRPPIGPLASSDSRPPLFGSTSESSNTGNVTTAVNSKPSFPWPPSIQSPRPQLPTSTSTGTTTTTSSTTMTTGSSASGGLDTEESNDLLKEPGVMYILSGEQPPQNGGQAFTPGYGGATVGPELGSGSGPGVGAAVGAGVVGAGVGTGLVGSGSEVGVTNNENDNEEEDDASLYGSNRGGESPSVHSAFASSNVLAAPSPQTPGSLRAYAGIVTESEDSHYSQPLTQEQSETGQYPVRRSTPMLFVGSAVPAKATPKSETTSPLIITKSPGPTSTGGIPDRLGRKPSGARELGAPRHGSNLGSPVHSHQSGASVSNSIIRAATSSPVAADNISTSSRAFTEDGSVMEATVVQASKVRVGVSPAQNGGASGGQDDSGVGEEALMYLNFADGNERATGYGSSTTSLGPTTTTTTPVAIPPTIPVPPPPPEVFSSSIEPLKTRHPIVPARSSSSGIGGVSDANELPYTESSFAPSNKAAERKAKAKAQKDAHLAAVHKPGRTNGKKKSMAGAWDSSDDEEEEEEDDEDVDSDGAKRRESVYKGKGQHQLQSGPSGSASSSALGHGRPGLQLSLGGIVGEPPEILSPSQLRPPRNLPQIPGRQNSGEENTISRRIPSEQYVDNGRRTYYEEGPQIRTQAEAPMPGSQRQTIWTKVLDPGQQTRPQSEHAAKETFVQLEPSETMTKAFALHGLLSVGMQDKEDRSAKRQEELARESGASLINVPNKPPPPQSGLLGYVTAHERERKREGGLGAALTEREREKRVAEERQRRLDEQQRQQLDQMQQGMVFNPMMNQMMMNMMMNNMNPMMTGGGLSPMMTGGGMGGMGMNPMMTGGGMGMNPMMSGYGGMMGGGGGYSPQHMFAAQHAAQAYQQAMTAFSVAGSQVGGPTAGGGGGNGAEGGGSTSQGQNVNAGMSSGMGVMMNPAMTGNMGFDPRMSTFGMNNMMGMGMGMPSMGMGGGLGPQITGMSNFDAMASPGLGFANTGGGGMGMGMNASPNPNERGGSSSPSMALGGLGLQPPTMPHSQFSSRTSSPAGRGSPKVSGPGNGEYHHHQQQQHDRGRPSRPATPK